MRGGTFFLMNSYNNQNSDEIRFNQWKNCSSSIYFNPNDNLQFDSEPAEKAKHL